MTGWIVVRQTAAGPRYDARYRVGPGAIRGKTFTKRRAAEAYLAEMVRRVHDGSYVEPAPIVMRDVFARYLEHEVDVRVQEGSLKPSTVKSYKSMIQEHLEPAFGAYRSDRLTLATVEAWRKDLAGRVAAGTLAPKTLVNLRNLLHAICTWARHPSRRYLVHDPLDGLPALRLPRGKKRPHFEPDQLRELLRHAVESPPDDTIVKVAILGGLRRGEIFGLQWSDVELLPPAPGASRAAGRIHVRRSYYQGALTTPKTRDSFRVVDVPPHLLDELARYKVLYPPLGEHFIFRQPSGRPMDPDAWHRDRCVPLLVAAGIRRPGAGLHSLRHSYVSILAAQGEDVAYVAAQVGHASTQLTRDVYQHVFQTTRSAAMEKLDRWAEGRESPTV
jgi:integrase